MRINYSEIKRTAKFIFAALTPGGSRIVIEEGVKANRDYSAVARAGKILGCLLALNLLFLFTIVGLENDPEVELFAPYKVFFYFLSVLISMFAILVMYFNNDIGDFFKSRKGTPVSKNQTEHKINNVPILSAKTVEEGPWEDSVTAVCRAVLHVFQEGRKDWVSGQEPGTGDVDSAGKETFRALIKRMHPKGERCRSKAEAAAWKVLSDNGYKHPGGRKQNP